MRWRFGLLSKFSLWVLFLLLKNQMLPCSSTFFVLMGIMCKGVSLRLVAIIVKSMFSASSLIFFLASSLYRFSLLIMYDFRYPQIVSCFCKANEYAEE